MRFIFYTQTHSFYRNCLVYYKFLITYSIGFNLSIQKEMFVAEKKIRHFYLKIFIFVSSMRLTLPPKYSSFTYTMTTFVCIQATATINLQLREKNTETKHTCTFEMIVYSFLSPSVYVFMFASK